MSIDDYYRIGANWSNANQGVVTIAIFTITLALGWITGIFDALRRKPRFRIRMLEGPTFCCTFTTGVQENGYDVHRSAFALYLHISNTGSSSGSIDAVHIGYHWSISPFSIQWVKYRLGWHWLKNQTSAIEDFRAMLGKNMKVYPFLFQKSSLSGSSSETFLQIGQSTNGMVYFEQSDSWGACFPLVNAGRVRLRVRIIDAFGHSHSQTLSIPSMTLEEARAFNPEFGSTIAHLRGEIATDEVDGDGDGDDT